MISVRMRNGLFRYGTGRTYQELRKHTQTSGLRFCSGVFCKATCTISPLVCKGLRSI